ncbi:glycosyl transferase [Isoptericola sp. b515]|uniref:glycosyl transferase n=1 Tax=Isoptericola sp. b515 TaxID=3064652 RepID=UPI00271417A9|nr:glycosyl transferase [Isoptericola sp. b515]MDO8148001.1 glycosyl transferase [Isoptericola sp. b515]
MAGVGRGAGLRRTVRSAGGRLIRRFGILPGGVPDGLGEDEALQGTTLSARAVVFFGDPPQSMYQIRQWYTAFAALQRRVPLVVITGDSRTARLLRSETSLRVVTVAQHATLDEILTGSDVRLALYVNHSPQNFTMLSFGGLIHVSLLHGDSDKTVSVSNQHKAYDLVFVAGQAAVDRFDRNLPYFDAAARCVRVGRPQLDVLGPPRTGRPDTGRTTVLYAPTWEGANPSVAYGSLDVLGPQLAQAVVNDPHLRLLYRPHPLTGVRSSVYGRGDVEVREIIAAARASDPEAGHGVRTDGELAATFDEADVLVCDISAAATEWLPTVRPLVVTDVAAPWAAVASTPLLGVAPRLGVDDVDGVTELLRREALDDPHREERRRLVEYYLGDVTPGASLARFVTACEEAIDRHEAELARLAARRDAG